MAEDNEEEIYSGFGTLNESSDLDVSRLITEEDLIDSLFFICDADKTGYIPVSRIIDFVKCTINVTEAGQSELDELVNLLDPKHEDVLVNLDTCRKQISEWIEKLKPQSELADVSMPSMKTPKSKSRYSSDIPASGAKRLKFEGGDFVRPSEVLIADLNSKIETLENQKKKMSEENAKLRLQLEAVEETAAFQSQKLEEMTRRMRSLQQIVERREQTLSENGDLKSTVSILEEKRKELLLQLKQMERANTHLENQVFDLEQKLVKAKTEVQIAEKQQNDMQTALFKQKHLWTKTEEEKELIEARLMEKSRKIEDLQQNLDNFKKSNCELKDQKVELELQLSEMQQKLTAAQMKAEKFGLPSSLASSDEECEPVSGPSAASTPKMNKGPKKSLGMELRKMLEDDKHLPSPLCEREWEDSVFLGLNEKDSVNNNKLDFSSGLARLRDITSSNDDINHFSSSVTSEIMQRQQLVIKKMTDLVEAADPSDQAKLCCTPSTFKMNLKDDFEFLTKKINDLSHAKKKAEDRASRLMTGYQKLKDENIRLHQIHEDSLQQMLDCSSGFQATLDGRLLIIKEQLEEKKKTIRDLEDKASSMKLDLNKILSEKLQLQCTVDDLKREKGDMEKEIHKLKQNNLEVSEKLHKSELKALELKEEVQNSLGILSKETQRCKHLEESLAQSQHGHQVDLQEIWRVVQKEVERDQRNEQEELYRSTDCLKGQVAREIETLKSQLYKTQAAFTALKHKTKQLQAPVGKCELRISHPTHQYEDPGPSSPLVDALTIEFFDGHQLSRRNSRKSHTFATVEEALYGQGNLSAPSRSRDLAISCPSLSSQNELVTSSTQTEEVRVSSHTNLNTSNSSSTSGVLDLDVSSGSLRSLDGRIRRKNFLRSLQRFDSESQTSQSLESNTDTDISIPRQRSPSFLAAIESGKSDPKPSSELGLKRTNSFTTAIENHANGPIFPRSRSSSFQAAIESGQRTPTEDLVEMDFVSTSPEVTPENPNFPDYVLNQWGNVTTYNNNNNNKQTEQRTVSFVSSIYIPDDNLNAEYNEIPSHPQHGSRQDCPQYNNSSRTSTNLKYVTDQNSNSPCFTGKTSAAVEADLLGKTTNAVSQQTEERRLSPKPARKLSTLVEEDLVEADNSSPENAEELSRRIALESSFHDNDRVLTTFSEVHTKMPGSPSVPQSSPARYASVMSVKLDCNSPVSSPRCSARNVNRMVSPAGCSGSPVNSGLDPGDQQTQVPPVGRRVAYTPPASIIDNQGSKSPLLSEKSSLVAKANRSKLQQNKQETSRKTKTQTDAGESTPDISSAPKVKSARKNLARLIIEHDAANRSSATVETVTTHTVVHEDQSSEQPSGMDSQVVSPRSKNRPLTRHLSIHEETTDGIVSFHPSANTSSKSPVAADLSEVELSRSSTQDGSTNHTDQYDALTRDHTSPKPPKISSPISLAKIREEHLARKREQMKHFKMPELSELTEGASQGKETPQVTHLKGITGMGDTPMKNPAYPSLPDDVLRSLGLFKENKCESNEQLTDQEVEEKFARLALAFKTDKLTLEKRLEIQERSRDVAEQNIEKELQGIKESVISLNSMCVNVNTRDMLAKLQHHLDVLEQSTVRVSSRAEVYGAVQQESRMSKAIDVMIQHVENLKLLHEKEHTELEEARKFLQDNRVYNSLQGSETGNFDAINLSKRSLSLAGNATVKGARRRNSVSVLPKILGGSGTPFSLSQSSSMDSSCYFDSRMFSDLSESWDEDPKTRFQSAIASTTVRSAVAGALRRASTERSPSNPSPNLSKQSVIQDKPLDKSTDEGGDRTSTAAMGEAEKKKTTEEDAFQRGFEQGVRAHLGREMTELREQQQAFCDTLEELMDENELTPEEAESDKGTVIDRLWQLFPEWEKSGQKIRLTLAGFVCLMALCSIFFSLMPVGAVTVEGSLTYPQKPPA
ncbi:uncharacterized protein LOC135475948 isoform X2 [Liolophura sinensis]|uniref:uncharacterized protein LOC135475948 isoform X2 n=1 Tax=Liolophura sinensis TaxID=3198878 RepID=UPI0031592F18